MGVLTSWTFWIILGVIVLVMALIGYLAEGTDFANKALEKKPKEKKEKPKKEEKVKEIKPKSFEQLETEIPVNAGLAAFASGEVVDVDKPIEVLKVSDEEVPSAWTDDTPIDDERQETVVNVPTIDDWSVIPESNELPEVKLDELTENNSDEVEETTVATPTEPVEEVSTIDSDVFPDITPSDLEPSSEIAVEEEPFEQEPVVMESEITSESEIKDNKTEEDVWKV